MLKGCQRRMIVVRETGSPYFDCAYFVLRCDLPEKVGESDILKEARRLIESCGENRPSLQDNVSAERPHRAVRRKAVTLLIAFAAFIPVLAVALLLCFLI